MSSQSDATQAGGGHQRTQFAELGHVTQAALLEPRFSAFLWSYAVQKLMNGLLRDNDVYVPATPSAYGDQAFDALLEYVRPDIERITGIGLYPTYSYFRLYKTGDVLHRHRDRDACEISVSMMLGSTNSVPWPLHLEDSQGVKAIRLAPGDALVYRGCELPHWRERFEGGMQAQVFLHYVDRDGANDHLRFDGRKTLMSPPVTPGHR